MSKLKAAKGFSLVELVTVIILLGILAATILPRFSSRDGFSEYALRDQLISAYHLAQQRAMYDHSGTCYRLNIDSNGFAPQRDGVTISEPVGEISFSGDYIGLSIVPSIPIFFDGLGNTYTGSCGGSALADSKTFTVKPSEIQFRIFSTGYIKAL